MALFKNMTITYKGMALFAKAQAGQEIHFTKMQVGSGKMGTQNPITFISLLDPKLDVPIISINPNSELKSATIIGHITNKNVKEAMYICEIGLFAKDPDDGEILYGYVNCGEYGDYYAPQSQGPYSWQYEISAAIGNAANVTAELSQIQWDYGVKNSNNNFKELKGSNQKEINESIDELLLSTNKKIEQIELTAEKVTITDTENNFVGDNVEEALQETVGLVKKAQKQADTSTEKANAAQRQAEIALQKAEQAFQDGVNVKERLVSALSSKGINLTNRSTWNEITSKIYSLETITRTFQTDWKVNFGERSTNLNEFIGRNLVMPTDNNSIYCAFKSNVTKYSINRNLLKQYHTAFDEIVSIAIDEYYNVYCAEYSTFNSRITKINAEGSTEWTVSTNSQVFEIYYYNNALFLGSTNKVISLNANNGNVRWTVSANDNSQTYIRGLEHLIREGKNLLLFVSDKFLNAINMLDGSQELHREIHEKWNKFAGGIITDEFYITINNNGHWTRYYYNYYWNSGDVSFGGPSINYRGAVGRNKNLFGIASNSLNYLKYSKDTQYTPEVKEYKVESIDKSISMIADKDNNVYILSQNGYFIKLKHVFESIKLL